MSGVDVGQSHVMAATNELGSFLRSRREQLRPADVGLPDTRRRRTPGLRREEVAALAGLSIDYLVRLEQGRDRNPSGSVVSALATALRLDPVERAHLGQLAACAASPDLCPSGSGEVDVVPPTVRVLLDRVDPLPAFVVGPWYQVVAHNRAWERIMGPIGALDGSSPNLARFTFLDDRASAAFPAWSDVADEQAAALRDARVRWRHDDRLLALLDELLAVPGFVERWQAHDVAHKTRGTKRIVHPVAGELRVDYEVLLLTDDTDQRFVSWSAADALTATALDQICGDPEPVSPATLRIVG